jgi:hypothetical protein
MGKSKSKSKGKGKSKSKGKGKGKSKGKRTQKRTQAGTQKKNKNLSKKKPPGFCSPHVEDNKKRLSNSCFDRDALIKIATSWNQHNSDNEIKFRKNTSSKSLYKMINEKMKDRCNNEYCWVKQDFMKDKVDKEEELQVFKPEKPDSWDKNEREWLNTLDIRAVMDQYEDKYQDFLFVGPVPIDFDEKLSFGQCVVDELCKINLKQMNKDGINRLGVIFNLDKHTQSGSHWVAMFCSIPKKEIYYWDSYGMRPPGEVIKLMNRLKKQGKDMDKNMKIKINDNRHQFKGSECGVYCINFIVNLLEGKTFKYITQKIVNDDKMWKKRKTFFNYQQ